MHLNIITNVGNGKKPWESIPVEVLIEDERKRKESLIDHREHLHAPRPNKPQPEDPSDPKLEHEDDYKIVIKL